MTAVLFGIALAGFAMWVGWTRAAFPGPLAVEEEWVLLGVVDRATAMPFWNGLLAPWIGRLMAELHGPGFLDLRLLSLVATAWSFVLLTRIAGHYAGPVAGILAASFYAASYGIGATRFELVGGHALALAGVLQGVQLALLGFPRSGVVTAALVGGLAFDLAGPALGVGTWLLEIGKGLPCAIAFALTGVVALASSRRSAGRLVALLVATLLCGVVLRWREPFHALLAVCAGVGLRMLIRNFALLTPLHLAMRFVLLFAVFGQLTIAGARLVDEVPTEAQRRNALAIASIVAELGGEVWAPTRPFLTWNHKHGLVADPASARALLTGSALLEVKGAPHEHAVPACPPKEHTACRVGQDFEQLWWHVRSDDQKLLERVRGR